MAKGWEHFSTVNDTPVKSEQAKKTTMKTAERIMRKTKTLSEEELKKASDKRYAEKIAREEELLAAYEEKKLKSKKLIRETRQIKARRDKEAAEAKKTEETKTPV